MNGLPQNKRVLTGKIFLKEFFFRLFSDPSALTLFLSNLVVIYYAVSQHWNASTVVAVYFAQSLIIGFFNVFKVLSLEKFSTEGYMMNGHPVDPTPETKKRSAGMFIITFGSFHVLYAVFIGSGALGGSVDIRYVLSASFYFFANHLFSFFYNRRERQDVPNIGNMMFIPFVRILPTHLIIIFGSFVSGFFGLNTIVVISFLLLKTAADLGTHVFEHFPWGQFVKDLDSRYV